MLDLDKKKTLSFESEKKIAQGYNEMGNLNSILSEEGLMQDIIDLKEYEKNLMESE